MSFSYGPIKQFIPMFCNHLFYTSIIVRILCFFYSFFFFLSCNSKGPNKSGYLVCTISQGNAYCTIVGNGCLVILTIQTKITIIPSHLLCSSNISRIAYNIFYANYCGNENYLAWSPHK